MSDPLTSNDPANFYLPMDANELLEAAIRLNGGRSWGAQAALARLIIATTGQTSYKASRVNDWIRGIHAVPPLVCGILRQWRDDPEAMAARHLGQKPGAETRLDCRGCDGSRTIELGRLTGTPWEILREALDRGEKALRSKRMVRGHEPVRVLLRTEPNRMVAGTFRIG